MITRIKAKPIIISLMNQLKPHCQKITVTGSYARKSEWCNDLEINVLPKYKAGTIRTQGFIDAVLGLGSLMGGLKTQGLGQAKHVKVWVEDKIKLDLFICNEKNWGLNQLIRTGPAKFSQEVMTAFNKLGYTSSDGVPKRPVVSGGLFGLSEIEPDRPAVPEWQQKLPEQLIFECEEDIFTFLRVNYIKPEHRRKGALKFDVGRVKMAMHGR